MAEPRGLVRVTSYTEQAQEVIKRLIFDGTYKPGERLKEVELSQTLGISRSPIREAIQGLANEGLIKLVPQKGAYVSTFDLQEIRNLFEVLEVLEGLSARLAAERSTPSQIEELGKLLESTRDSLESDELAGYPRDLSLYPKDMGFHSSVAELTQNRALASRAAEIRDQLRLARARLASARDLAKQTYQEHRAIYRAILAKDPDKAEKVMRFHLRNGLRNTIAMFAESNAKRTE
jgi:DNA-binding GntR family transcriptional regulator